jgi:hypothetical protein
MDDFAEILMDRLLEEEKKELLIFDLFDQVIKPHEHAEVASSLRQRILKRPSKKINEEWLDGTINFLKDSQKPVVLSNYIQPLDSVRDQLVQEVSFYFNEQQLPINFRAILLNLIAVEKNEGTLAMITGHILQEMDKLSDQEKPLFFQMMIDVIKQRGDQERLRHIFDPVYCSIGQYVESAILQGKDVPGLEIYLRHVKVSALKPDDYLNRIFDPGNRHQEALRLFFKFFPASGLLFCERLRPHLNDTKYILEWVERFRSFTEPSVLSVLRFIYDKKNLYVKIEVLKIMETLDFFDDDFLLSIMKTKSENIMLKETAMKILLRDPHYKQPLLEALFEVTNFLGKNNALLSENILLAQKLDLRDARDHLIALSKSPALWSRGTRRESLKVLKEWEYGNH